MESAVAQETNRFSGTYSSQGGTQLLGSRLEAGRDVIFNRASSGKAARFMPLADVAALLIIGVHSYG